MLCNGQDRFCSVCQERALAEGRVCARRFRNEKAGSEVSEPAWVSCQTAKVRLMLCDGALRRERPRRRPGAVLPQGAGPERSESSGICATVIDLRRKSSPPPKNEKMVSAPKLTEVANVSGGAITVFEPPFERLTSSAKIAPSIKMSASSSWSTSPNTADTI